MSFLSSLGGPLAGKLGGAINPLSGLGMAGGPMSGMGAMGGGGNGLGSILASLGLGGGGKGHQGGQQPPPVNMPGAMGNVSSPMDPISQGPSTAPTNFGQANPGHGGMPPGLAQAFQRIGAGLQQQGQAPQDGPLPQAQFQQFDPLQFLSSLGQNNWLGQLGGMR